MSCYEWEEGVIRLPSSQYAMVKKAVEAAARRNAQAIYDHAQAFWKSLPSRAKNNVEVYRKHVHAYVYGNQPGGFSYDPKLPTQRGLATTAYNDFGSDLLHALEQVLHYVVEETREYVGGGGSYTHREYKTADRPRRVKQSDVNFPTNRTLRYACGEPDITFDPKAKTVTWSVPENNHARDHAREHPIAQALFRALRAVKWTRGSGGQIIGNDEYNRDSHYEGGGGNYVVEEFGPQKKSRTRVAARGW